jgi:hypothetical protein
MKIIILIGAAFLSSSLVGWAGTASIGKSKQQVESPPTAVARRQAFRLSAGYNYRSLGDAGFRGGSYSSGVRLPFLATAAYVGRPTRPGRYDDGYVLPDAGTATNGDTWWWGYENASQVSATHVSFHGPGGYIGDLASSRESSSSQWLEDLSGGAPVVQLDWLPVSRLGLEAGLSLQWSFLAADGSQGFSNFSASQSSSVQALNLTDKYALQGVIPPTAPYTGSIEGPGPLLPATPDSRSLRPGAIVGRGAAEFANAITQSFDLDLHTISLGPTLEKRWGSFAVNVSGGMSLNVASWDASHQERLFAGNRVLLDGRARESGTDLLTGGYVQTGLTVDVAPRWTLSVYARHDWVEDFATSVGPATFHFDASGWSVGALVGRRF